MELAGGMGVIEVQTAPAAQKHVSAEPGDRHPEKTPNQG